MTPSPLHPRCPVRTALELLGGKWRLLLLREIAAGHERFGALRRALPDISEKMLAQELRTLADNHLVHRVNHGEVPPRVEYRLTENGRRALDVLGALAAFGEAYRTPEA